MNDPAPAHDPLESLIAARNRRTARSASNEAAQRVRELIASGKKVVNLTAGEPDFETPDNIRDAAIRAITRGQTRYTTVDGTEELKAAIVGKFARENRLNFSPHEVLVGCGAKHVIFNAFMATIDKGDEVITAMPRWVSYPEMVRFAGGTPVEIACRAETGFKLTPEALEAAITPRTKWLVLNTPNNPSGAVYTREELRALAAVLERHPQVWVMMDDIYEHIIFDGRKFETMASAAPEISDRVLTVNGVSKAYAMTGWRIGYAAGPAGLISEMGKIQTQSTSNPCSVSQAAAVEALNGPQDAVRRNTQEYQRRRDVVVSALNVVPGLVCLPPEGAFYVFTRCDGVLGGVSSAGKTIVTDRDLVAHLLEFGVAGIAGAAYGTPDFFRLTIATSLEALEEGCRRIAAACEDIRG